MPYGLGAQTRRDMLILATGVLAVATLQPLPAAATPAEVAAAIKQRFGDRKLSPGKVKLTLPEVFDNGSGVPLEFEVESPMTAQDHVKGVYVFADGNPLPVVAEYQFSPAIPRAAAQMRIRLLQSQSVVCVAEMSDGTLYTDRREVKVTIGACGG